MSIAAAVTDDGAPVVPASELRKVVFASSLGTLFEWYDFYLYGSLAIFFSALFYPKDNETAGFLAVLATYGAGYVVRPLGALFFGRLGDMIGRKYTFLITITLMGGATAIVGFLPTFESIGWAAPVLLMLFRLIQGFALGGESGGALTYVAEHAPHGKRGYLTAWIQTTASVGLILSLLVILVCRSAMDGPSFAQWGWRIPFFFSVVLLGISVYVRARLHESPAFSRMQAAGTLSKSPIRESFGNPANLKLVLLALFGVIVGEGVVWNCGNFYVLFFITSTLKVDYRDAYLLIMIALVLGSPLVVLFGALSDRIGRKWIMMAGFLAAALTLMPIYKALTHAANPQLAQFLDTTEIRVEATDCHFNVFSKPVTECDKVRDFLTRGGISYEWQEGKPGTAALTRIGKTEIRGFDDAALKQALKSAGYPEQAASAQINRPLVVGLLLILMVYVGMVYGPVAAFIVELFPARIRYTSVSLPFHLGNGVVAGFLAFFATALSVYTGNIYSGLWYPIGFALLSLVIGSLFVPETRGNRLTD